MTPEQEEQVRRALASLPPPQSMPPDVAARLDARLEELRAERGAETAGDAPAEEQPTTPGWRDTERRDRRWPRLLVAAAVLAVVGIGVGTVLDGTGGGGESTTAGDAASGGRALEAAPEQAPNAYGPPAGVPGRLAQRMILTAERLELDSRSLAEDVTRLSMLRLPRAEADDEAHSQEGGASAPRRLARLFAPCALPPTRPGDKLVAVRLDGSAATLVLREAEDGTRVAQVYSCDDPRRLLARTEVDAR